MRTFSLAAVLGLALVAAPALAQPPPAQVGSFLSELGGPVGIYPVADGLARPWAMTFLPDGRMLVTERPGHLRIVTPDGGVSGPVEGVPEVYARGQGGLLDVALDPDFESNRFVYLSYARPNDDGSEGATAVGRGRLVDDRIEGFEPLFTAEPYMRSGGHFGSRIEFSPSGEHLFLTTGERFQFDPSQDLSNALGTVVRIHRDGTIPSDNPFEGDPDMEQAIWSYGHRNIQAAAFGPDGALYVAEMGPLGGDELNRVEAGANYGWPLVSWGMDYDGELIPDPTTRADLTDAVLVWSPCIAPSGMAFYNGDVFPGWQGHMLVGSLVYRGLVHVVMENGEVVDEHVYPIGQRIRDVEQGPDGRIYVLTDQENPEGQVLVLRPIETRPPPEGG